MEVIMAYIFAVLAGVTLGIMGSGGSILTVPILVYLMGYDMVSASAFSLFIVGVSSLAGALRQAGKKNIDFRTAIYFGLPSLVSVMLVRAYLIPHIPKDLFGVTDGKDLFLMLLFVLLMLVAAISMLLESPKCDEQAYRVRFGLLISMGLLEGLVTGLVGAGGGFLIVPVLVLMCKMNIKRAIATSLLMVGVKSIFGFLGHLQTGAEIDWKVLLVFAVLTLAGILIGITLSGKISSEKLKKYFAYFVLIMAAFILTKEVINFLK